MRLELNQYVVSTALGAADAAAAALRCVLRLGIPLTPDALDSLAEAGPSSGTSCAGANALVRRSRPVGAACSCEVKVLCETEVLCEAGSSDGVFKVLDKGLLRVGVLLPLKPFPTNNTTHSTSRVNNVIATPIERANP